MDSFIPETYCPRIAVAQRQWLQGEILEKYLSYWRQRLNNSPPNLELSTDRSRPPVQSFRGAWYDFELPQTLVAALKALSQVEGVTLFITLLAAFQTLLQRYTRQDDIVVGSPAAGRLSKETESLIGLSANPLALHTDLAGNPTFRQLLGRVHTVVLEAYAYQGLPFEKSAEELQPEQDPSHHPLFHQMFVLQQSLRPTLELPGLDVRPIEVESQMALCDLTLSMVDEEERLRGSFEYNTELFDATTITRLVGHFQTLLTGIVADPEQSLSALPLLTETERQQLLVEWNNTVTDYSQDRCIHQLFEAQVERTPVATAVVCEDLELTYEELNRRANQLAHYLRKRGVGPEVLVGIYMRRSLEMIVGLLGVLKAGGAYVPMDLMYPQERLAFMLEDTQVSVLLTQEQLAVRLPAHQAGFIYLDTDWETIARESTGNPVAAAAPENLACVLYTSGSTGKPKGVMIQHRSVVNYTETASVEFALEPRDRVLQFASISFDSSLEEIFPCLSRGATLVLRSESIAESFSTFLQKCHDLALTVLDLPTGYWHELTTRLEPAERFVFPPSLRLVIIGGERALRERLRAWQPYVGQRVRLINTYGPTETTVVATMCELSGTVEVTSREVPIGRVIRNAQIYVLDQHRQPVPVGVPGELHIGGAGLARGYLNRPELTAEKFIPHPFSTEPGARLYKTGDLARYLPDGTLEFLGRIDHQVKIHGFRVEPEEIETVLSQHPAVRQVVVTALEKRPDDRQLVAYIVPRQELAPTVSELRRFLEAKLPEYMIPSAFVWLDALLLTPNGKVDYRALPAPVPARPQLEKDFVAPRDALELQLTRIWAMALGVEPIGVRDNFFELGGHSLLAVHLCEQIAKKFGKDLSPATLFQAPTIEQLASILRQKRSVASWSLLAPFQLGGSKPPFFCLFSSVALAHQLDPDQPFYGLQPHGLAGRRAPSTVEEIAIDYLKEIQALQPKGPYFLGGFSFGGLVAFEMAQQLYKQGQTVSLLALLDPTDTHNSQFSSPVSPSPFNLLAKITLVRDKIGCHSHTLALLKPQEKLAYILEKIKGKLKGEFETIEDIIKKMVCQLYLGIRCRLPQSLRMFYFLETSEQAARKYVPHVYPGRIILFQSKSNSLNLQPDWSRLAAGGLEVHEVPGNHLDMMSEPHVRTLATKLRACLSQRQAVESAKEV